MDAYNKERIARLRERSVEPVVAYQRFRWFFHQRYAENSDLGSKEARYADAYRAAFDRLEPVIDEDELIVGKCNIPLTAEENEAYWQQAAPVMVHCGQDSHMTVDLELVLKEGLSGIAAKAAAYKAANTDPAKRAFYDVCMAALEAVMAHSVRYAEEAQRQAALCADPVRKEELLHIAQVCRRVPAQPATDFYEAVQAVHFVNYCLSQDPLRPGALQFQLGRPDSYLLPYYEAGLANGTLTKDMAQTLINCLAIQINNRVPSGLSSGYMVGGRDKNGHLVANDLTLMCMQAVADVRLVYPAVGLCVTSETPSEYLEKACQVLAQGCSHPAIFNDDVITKGLMSYGMPENEAHSYTHSTCVEITPEASSNVWVASPYTNMAQLLLDTIAEDHGSFEALLAAMFARLNESIRRNCQEQCAAREERRQRSMFPLLSCLINDCLERGLDVEQGGARYNWIMPSFVGMANLTDGLYALKKLVFETGEVSMEQLRAALAADFVGNETLLRRIESLPKYGNDNDEVDSLYLRITEHIAAQCRQYTTPFSEGKLIPSVFCWIMHEQFGTITGATPDGRRAGFPLGDGSGPCQGRERCGPTASVLSTTKWNHADFIGGVALNMKFSRRTFTSESFKTMEALIRTYLEQGGFEIQINVTDKETLLAAQKDPEKYKDLVVRIGGYSDYFVRLSPAMQAEVLLRTEHAI